MACTIHTAPSRIKSLITKKDKLAVISQLFLSKRNNSKGKIFTPSIDFYSQEPVSDEQLVAMGNELLRWLGVKHHSLRISFSTNKSLAPSLVQDAKKPKVTVPYAACLDSAYCAALLSHILMHYVLSSRHHTILDDGDANEEFVDLACIHTGLGIVLLNGYASYGGGFYGLVHRARHQKSFGLQVQQITEEVRLFIRENRLSPSQWTAITLPGARAVLGAAPFSLPAFPYIKTMQQRVQRFNLKTIFLIFLSLITIGLWGYWYSQKPKALTPELMAQKERIEALREQYQACEAFVNRKRQLVNNDDFLIIRNLEADENRCKSIRNKHNYEVRDFNIKTRNL